MYCQNCNNYIQDGAQTCMYCGTPLRVGARRAVQGGMNAQLKRLAGSPLVLAAIICYSTMLLFSLISAFVDGNSTILNALNSLDVMDDFMFAYSSYYYRLRSVSMMLSILGQGPTIAICVGMWLIYASAKSRAELKNSGFRVIQIVTIIRAGLLCLLMLAMFIIMLVAASAMSNSVGKGFVVGFIFSLLLSVAVMAFYYVKVIVMLDGISQMIASGRKTPAAGGVVAVIVYTILFAVGALIGCFASNGIFAMLSGLVNCGALVCFIIVLFRYRSWYMNARETAGGGYGNGVMPQTPPERPFESSIQAAPGSWNGGYAQQGFEDIGTVVLGNPNAEGGGTVLLKQSGPAAALAAVVRISTGERQYIRSAEFYLGKSPNGNDFVVSGNAAVSRKHAVIRQVQTGYVIEDLNSSNHVYVNGLQITPGIPTQLSLGDRFFLANEEFEFTDR